VTAHVGEGNFSEGVPGRSRRPASTVRRSRSAWRPSGTLRPPTSPGGHPSGAGYPRERQPPFGNCDDRYEPAADRAQRLPSGSSTSTARCGRRHGCCAAAPARRCATVAGNASQNVRSGAAQIAAQSHSNWRHNGGSMCGPSRGVATLRDRWRPPARLAQRRTGAIEAGDGTRG
jgi:hypothetical protein